MDIKIQGNRAHTTSAYDPRILRAISKLEGMKKWKTGRVFSFENTAYNLEVWQQTFPQSFIDGLELEGSTELPADAAFDVVVDRPTFQYKTPPRRHQKEAVDKLIGKKACGLFMDIGTGKSWTGITFMGRRWCEGKIDFVLLVAKNGIHEQWINDAFPAHMSPSVKWKAWIWKQGKRAEKEFDALFDFDGLKVFAINTEAIRTPAAMKKILKFLAAARGKCFMLIDESQDIKTYDSARTSEAIKYGSLSEYRMIMTGTPISKNVIDLFSQFKFLDERILGNKYITAFKARYCEFTQGEFGSVVTGHKNIEELYRKIDPFIYRITSEEALDLPPKLFIPRPFSLSARQYELIGELKEQFYATVTGNDIVSVTNAAGLLTRMQQISCGFVVTEEEKIIRLNDNPRISALEDILSQRSDKVIIWCRFNQDVEMLMDIYGNDAVDYYGKTKNPDRDKNKRLFMDAASSKRFFIGSPEAAGTGTDGLQHVCHTAVYYSNSFNALARWQSEGRIWRDGTTKNATYFDLIAKSSPDRKILANLKDKKDISDLTLDGFRELIDFEEK